MHIHLRKVLFSLSFDLLAEAADLALGDTSHAHAGARLTGAVALGNPLRAALAMGGPGQALDLQLHQALGGEADHLAQQIGVGALFQKRAKGHHLIGHRWILGSVAWFSDQTLPMVRDGHRKPLARYGAIGARSLAACSAELHHHPGRDLELQRQGDCGELGAPSPCRRPTFPLSGQFKQPGDVIACFTVDLRESPAQQHLSVWLERHRSAMNICAPAKAGSRVQSELS
jgi:hypothetical protein